MSLQTSNQHTLKTSCVRLINYQTNKRNSTSGWLHLSPHSSFLTPTLSFTFPSSFPELQLNSFTFFLPSATITFHLLSHSTKYAFLIALKAYMQLNAIQTFDIECNLVATLECGQQLAGDKICRLVSFDHNPATTTTWFICCLSWTTFFAQMVAVVVVQVRTLVSVTLQSPILDLTSK